jgi:hypothetical protein
MSAHLHTGLSVRTLNYTKILAQVMPRAGRLAIATPDMAQSVTIRHSCRAAEPEPAIGDIVVWYLPLRYGNRVKYCLMSSLFCPTIPPSSSDDPGRQE